MQSISIVIPVFNEQSNLKPLYIRLDSVVKKISKSHEIIFVNDGSTDKSLDTLIQLRKKDKRIKIISFTRNFGHMQAIDAGLQMSSGNKVVVMDADLQDPPEIIEAMWNKSKTGYNIVYGTKKGRKESIVKKSLFSMFYKILNKVSKLKMPENAGTFCLLDRNAVEIICALPERNKYFSGLRVWTGLKSTGVTYERASRYKGRPKPMSKLLSLGFDGIISFSYLPLRVASIIGFIFASISFLFILIVIIARFAFDKGIIGWASTMTTILFIGGVQLITLGIIGEYLARIYDEVKARPQYIISEKIGFNKK